MRPFDYEALDPAGRTRRGVITSESVRGARRDLRSRGLVPVRVSAADDSAKPKGDISLARNHLSHKDRSLVTRQLATLLEAALPVEEALNSVSQQSEKPHVRKALLRVRAHVMEGHKLSQALALEPKSFDQLYRAIVAAGENTGALGAVLARLADHLERTHELRTKIQTALIYPAALFLTAMSVVIILMTFVVPRVVEQFNTSGRTLPALTRVMIGVSDFLVVYGVWLLLALVLAGVAAFHALKQDTVRLTFDGALLRLPMLGKLVRDINCARLARTTATLLASGAPLLDALNSAKETVTNRKLYAGVRTMVQDVEEGSSLNQAFKKAALFPPLVTHMAAAGEASGTLASMLEKAAKYMEQSFESFITALLSLLEPAIIIFMGVIVAVIVLSILLPILSLNTLAGL